LGQWETRANGEASVRLCAGLEAPAVQRNALAHPAIPWPPVARLPDRLRRPSSEISSSRTLSPQRTLTDACAGAACLIAFVNASCTIR
jgi:hypothetical protein